MVTQQRVKYSIIIPHYDTPDLLRRCLASIPVREDVQVIVVDDNSPDSDNYLSDYPELSRPFLEFVPAKENRGAGYARNIGMDLAKGEWLIFADADDFFENDMGKALDQYADASEDIVFFLKRSVISEDIERVSHRDEWYNDILRKYLNGKNNESDVRALLCTPWAKFIRRDFLMRNNIRFEEIPYSNDVVFAVSAGCKAKSFTVVDYVLYVLTRRQGSLMSDFSKKRGELETRTGACLRAMKIIRESGYTVSRLPVIPVLYQCLLQDKALFRQSFRELRKMGFPSLDVINQLRWEAHGKWNKIMIYPKSFFTCILG